MEKATQNSDNILVRNGPKLKEFFNSLNELS